MKNESALIFIDGTIYDDRHRINLYGTAEFYSGEENIMNDKSVADSVRYLWLLKDKEELADISDLRRKKNG